MKQSFSLWIYLAASLVPINNFAQDFQLLKRHPNEEIQSAYDSIAPILQRRKWKDESGNFSVTAELQSFDHTEQKVVLKVIDRTQALGRPRPIIKVPMSRLCEDDKDLVQLYLKHQPTLLISLADVYEDKIENYKSAIKLLEEENAKAKQELKMASSEIKKLKTENSRSAKFAPSNKLANDDGTPIVTQGRLEALGEKYENKPVRVVNCRFLATRPLCLDMIIRYTPQHLTFVSTKTHFSFTVMDSNGAFIDCIARKETHAEFILALKKGQKLNLKAYVGKYTIVGDEYYLSIKQIEKVGMFGG